MKPESKKKNILRYAKAVTHQTNNGASCFDFSRLSEALDTADESRAGEKAIVTADAPAADSKAEPNSNRSAFDLSELSKELSAVHQNQKLITRRRRRKVREWLRKPVLCMRLELLEYVKLVQISREPRSTVIESIRSKREPDESVCQLNKQLTINSNLPKV